MSLLPVPVRPQTNQLSMISQSSTGSRKNAPCGGPSPFATAIMAPSLPQRAISQPLANDHRPFSTYPPSTGTAVPVGAKQAKVKKSSSRSHNSRCVSIGKCDREIPFETAPLTVQPVEAQAAEMVSAIFSATSPSYSNPLNSLGRQVRSNSASRILSTTCGNRLRLRSVSSASARISGTISRARPISSSGLGIVVRRRIAAVVISGYPPLQRLSQPAGTVLKIVASENPPPQ